MLAKITSVFAAAAIALTTVGARPVSAGEDDLARALAAIVGIAIIGKVINDRKDDRAVTRHQYQQRPHVHQHRPQVIQPRPLPNKARRKLLPGDCLRSVPTRNGQVRYFGQRCLQKNFKFSNRLPARCSIRIRTYNGPRSGYDARCLRQEGYQLARR